jgi:uncharacterized membrane protein YfcA
MPDLAAPNNLLDWFALVTLGIAIGAFGTLIGAGGGFVLVPLLLFLYPRQTPAQLTAVSLAVVFVNACSGSVSYYRLRRADYRSGFLLAIATIPGAVVGAILVGAVPRGVFEAIMGSALLLVGALLAIRPKGRLPLLGGFPGSVERTIVDSEGRVHHYRFNLALAMIASIAVGFLSSILGIGGGIIHVPVLTTFFDFPEHIATATSHFVLIFTSGAGAGTHLFQGNYGSTIGLTVALAIGVLSGAPLGAALSRRVTGTWIIRLLAVALGMVGLRLLVAA